MTPHNKTLKTLKTVLLACALACGAVQAQTYPDSQNLFTLGRAAIYPAGSWEISGFNTQAQFKMGAFPPPVAAAGDTARDVEDALLLEQVRGLAGHHGHFGLLGDPDRIDDRLDRIERETRLHPIGQGHGRPHQSQAGNRVGFQPSALEGAYR